MSFFLPFFIPVSLSVFLCLWIAWQTPIHTHTYTHTDRHRKSHAQRHKLFGETAWCSSKDVGRQRSQTKLSGLNTGTRDPWSRGCQDYTITSLVWPATSSDEQQTSQPLVCTSNIPTVGVYNHETVSVYIKRQRRRYTLRRKNRQTSCRMLLESSFDNNTIKTQQSNKMLWYWSDSVRRCIQSMPVCGT